MSLPGSQVFSACNLIFTSLNVHYLSDNIAAYLTAIYPLQVGNRKLLMVSGRFFLSRIKYYDLALCRQGLLQVA